MLDSSRRTASTTPNPLRDRRDRRLDRIAGPSALVFFGITGDLARKKLMPAVYDLANRGLLPPNFAIVGFGRRDWDAQQFAAEAKAWVQAHARTAFNETVWEQLSSGLRFISGGFDDDDAFIRLRATLAELNTTRGTGKNHAFYLSIPRTPLSRSASSFPSTGWPTMLPRMPAGHAWSSKSRLGTT